MDQRGLEQRPDMRAGEYLRLYAMRVDGEMLLTLNKSLKSLFNGFPHCVFFQCLLDFDSLNFLGLFHSAFPRYFIILLKPKLQKQ